jgi:hypothetical protein
MFALILLILPDYAEYTCLQSTFVTKSFWQPNTPFFVKEKQKVVSFFIEGKSKSSQKSPISK